MATEAQSAPSHLSVQHLPTQVSGMIICKQNVRGKEKGNIVGKQGKRVYVSMHPANLSESCSSQH